MYMYTKILRERRLIRPGRDDNSVEKGREESCRLSLSRELNHWHVCSRIIHTLEREREGRVTGSVKSHVVGIPRVALPFFLVCISMERRRCAEKCKQGSRRFFFFFFGGRWPIRCGRFCVSVWREILWVILIGWNILIDAARMSILFWF